jgi:hypothetical protein
VTAAIFNVAFVFPGSSPRADAAPFTSIETHCAGSLRGATFFLAANCATTETLSVPNGHTVDGGGHIITVRDTTGGAFAQGVLRNAGTSMNLTNLTIDGAGIASDCTVAIDGILLDGANGLIRNVRVLNITRHCAGVGDAFLASNFTGSPRVVTIENLMASGYQSTAVAALGAVTVNVLGGTLGPPDPALRGIVAQGVVRYDGAHGTVKGVTLVGSASENASLLNTNVLLNGAEGVAITGNTITGHGTDIGIAVSNSSAGIQIGRNATARTGPNVPDTFGIGVLVEAGSSAQVACNTFAGWRANYVANGAPAAQSLCVMTTGLPRGTAGAPYTAAVIASGGAPPYHWSLASGRLAPGLTLSPAGVVSGVPTAVGAFPFTARVTDVHGAAAAQDLSVTVLRAPGYWLTARDGGVFTFGAAVFHGSTGNIRLRSSIVGIAATPGGGYWLAAADGGVFAFGARFFGSLGELPLARPIVGIAATPNAQGYYLVASDGGVFAFGNARFHGSLGGVRLARPIVGIAATPDAQGYYLVASDGGVFAFGNARFHGSLGNVRLAQPITDIAINPITGGYWLVATDGGVFSFGAPFLGSSAGATRNAPVVGLAATTDGRGYREVTTGGTVFPFGTAQPLGSISVPINQPIVGITSMG